VGDHSTAGLSMADEADFITSLVASDEIADWLSTATNASFVLPRCLGSYVQSPPISHEGVLYSHLMKDTVVFLTTATTSEDP
jgi:hypothetical protein